MATRVGVILAGCGYLDGAAIHEAVCTLLSLDQAGAEIHCFAPDVEFDVVDHRTQEASGERRNVLAESARIARGDIRDVAEADASSLDALALPGGFGAAKNLCTFASRGADCDINPDVARLLRDMHAQKKPIAAICIAPALVARALGEHAPQITIGNDEGTASALESLGARHVDCAVEDFVVDDEQKIVTTPAYMLGPSIKHVQEGIDKTVGALLDMAV